MVGARTVFFSKGKRIGHQELVALEENRSVAFVLEGAGPPHRPRMTFRLEPLGESQTRVVLDFANEFPRPFNAVWHVAGLSRWTRKMHRLDLAGLKAFCEPPHRDADGNTVGRPAGVAQSLCTADAGCRMTYYDHQFEGRLEELIYPGKYRYLIVRLTEQMAARLPFDQHPRLRASGEINDLPFHGAWMPGGDKLPYLHLSAAFVAELGIAVGDPLDIRFQAGTRRSRGAARRVDGGAFNRHRGQRRLADPDTGQAAGAGLHGRQRKTGGDASEARRPTDGGLALWTLEPALTYFFRGEASSRARPLGRTGPPRRPPAAAACYRLNLRRSGRAIVAFPPPWKLPAPLRRCLPCPPGHGP